MDLLGAIGSLRQAFGLLEGQPAWAENETTFEIHFGVSYEEFQLFLEHLTLEQQQVFQATLKVNPEAAILWILSMEPVG